MGARAGYTLATGLVIGLGAMAGVVSVLVGIVPEAAVAPILIFVGVEITAQAFLATPARHAPAVALAFIPTTAALVLIQVAGILGSSGVGPIRGEAAASLQTLRLLGNGFILTALLWSSALVFIIDARPLLAGAVFALASAASLCGLIHSPLPGGGLFWPWAMPVRLTAHLAGAYGVAAALCCLASLGGRSGPGRRDTA
jgi:AGZA family xanthine/uracil permease-like MFS transporter